MKAELELVLAAVHQDTPYLKYAPLRAGVYAILANVNACISEHVSVHGTEKLKRQSNFCKEYKEIAENAERRQKRAGLTKLLPKSDAYDSSAH